MDHFRPLYKQHRRGPATAFDPLVDERWGQYWATKTTKTSTPEPYSLEPHSYTEVLIPKIPGLKLCCGMLPLDLQQQLVRESTGLYLESPYHKTNFDAHMTLERPLELFRDKELTAEQIQRKLRWVTLGGQYNWTTKVYPSFEKGSPDCPEFPEQLGQFVQSAFGIHADAAIVNYYSQGDILSPHQDVAELCKSDLVSISLGCECIFYIGLERHDCEPLPILLRSGDVLVMGGSSRFAYHGVGRVFGGTGLDMDGELGAYIKDKRVNINIRQMFDR